ncbi:2-oxoacid:acceptor oxidoreductase family protein [Patescibacteria group bacterium]
MSQTRKKILFAGEGGQGVQVIAEILAKAAIAEGKDASYIPNFGVEQRGGVSLAFVIISSAEIVYPKFEKADCLAILSDRSVERAQPFIGPQTKVILGPAVKKGLQTKSPPKAYNVVVLGEVNRQGKFVQPANLLKALTTRFAKYFEKDPQLKKIDLEALEG